MATLDALPSAQQLYRDNLGLIDEIVAFACWVNRLPEAEATGFQEEVHGRLLEDDYRILRTFSGSSLRSYLKTVILRAGQGYRSRHWGRIALQGEAEARAQLRAQLDVPLGDEQVDPMGVRLPVSTYAETELAGEREDAPALDTPPEATSWPEEEGEERRRRILDLLNRTAFELPTQHRLLLKLLYEDGLTVSEVARGMGIAQKTLYRERDGALEGLRKGLGPDSAT